MIRATRRCRANAAVRALKNALSFDTYLDDDRRLIVLTVCQAIKDIGTAQEDNYFTSHIFGEHCDDLLIETEWVHRLLRMAGLKFKV